MTHTHTPIAITDVEEGMLLRVEFDQQIHLHAIEGPVGYQLGHGGSWLTVGGYNLETADRLYLIAPRVLVRTEHDYAALPPDTVLRIISTNQQANVWPVDELAWTTQDDGHNRTLRVDEVGDFTIADFVDAGVVCRVINPRTQHSAGEHKNTREKL